jgi:hypothetical protein
MYKMKFVVARRFLGVVKSTKLVMIFFLSLQATREGMDDAIPTGRRDQEEYEL